MSGAFGLLNPELESRVTQEMIKAIEDALDSHIDTLSKVVLDREAYLIKMGEMKALQNMLGKMNEIQGRNFKV